MPPTKLLTFESWVTRNKWYEYALKKQNDIPFMLIDRSPCQDPFFDPYAPSEEERIPLISGLCRGRKWFNVDDQYIYITRIDQRVYKKLNRKLPKEGPYYAGVAALTVKSVWNSHLEAAQSFKPRRYVVAPNPTPYPPNLAYSFEPEAAINLESSISYDSNKKPHIPTDTSPQLWREQYSGYYQRQINKGLRVAKCEIDTINGHRAIQLDLERVPIFTPADWNNEKLNVQGILIDNDKYANELRSQIADSNK